jgi:hypothetical protein
MALIGLIFEDTILGDKAAKKANAIVVKDTITNIVIEKSKGTFVTI